MADTTNEHTSSSSNINEEDSKISLTEALLRYAQTGIYIDTDDAAPMTINVIRNAVAHGKLLLRDRMKLTAENSSTFRIQILEEPLTAQSLFATITVITDLYTRCWLIQQKRFSDLMDYAQTRDPRFVREANLQVGAMVHNSPAIVDLLLNAGSIAGGAATLAFALKIAIDAIAQTPLRFEATNLKNLKEKQEQEIRGNQSQLDQQIAAQKAETEDKSKQQEQQLEAQKKLFELERQRMLLEFEKQKFEVESEKERAKLDRERLEFEKNRIVIVQEIAVTMVGQLLSSEDRKDAGRTEMLVHSLIPSLLQLSAIDAVVTTLPPTSPSEENKGSTEQK